MQTLKFIKLLTLFIFLGFGKISCNYQKNEEQTSNKNIVQSDEDPMELYNGQINTEYITMPSEKLNDSVILNTFESITENESKHIALSLVKDYSIIFIDKSNVGVSLIINNPTRKTYTNDFYFFFQNGSYKVIPLLDSLSGFEKYSSVNKSTPIYFKIKEFDAKSQNEEILSYIRIIRVDSNRVESIIIE